jgi:hypothetical protein
MDTDKPDSTQPSQTNPPLSQALDGGWMPALGQLIKETFQIYQECQHKHQQSNQFIAEMEIKHEAELEKGKLRNTRHFFWGGIVVIIGGFCFAAYLAHLGEMDFSKDIVLNMLMLAAGALAGYGTARIQQNIHIHNKEDE